MFSVFGSTSFRLATIVRRFAALLAALLLAAACSSADPTATPADIELVTTVPATTSTSVVAIDLEGLARVDPTDDALATTTTTAPLPTTSAPTAPTTTEAVAAVTTTVAVTTTAVPTAVPTTQPATTTTEFDVPPWRVGLLNSGAANFDAYRVGVEAAIAWRNTENAAFDLRMVELTSCTSDDAVGAAACANQLVGGSDALIRGIDTQHAVTTPIFEASGLTVVGGYALWAEDLASTHHFDVGGPPSVAAGLAGHAVDLVEDVIAVFHDDNSSAAALMAAAVEPVITGGGATVEFIPVPAGTTDATGLASQATVAGAGVWIVLSGPSSCVPLAQSHAAFGASAPVLWGENCATDGLRDQVAGQVAESWFGVELVEPWLLPVLGADINSAHEVASLGIAQIAPELASDPIAMRGWVTGLHVVDLLSTTGPDAATVGRSRLPHPLSLGDLDCNTAPVCSSDIMVALFLNGTLDGAPRVANGLARIS